MTGVAEVGTTANNYQVLARLATGGMAEIFLARGTSTTGVERYVVLKRILRDRANDVQLVKMFLDEARLASQLQHPNVAQVYDIGKLGDSYFFTMEYVHGETVRGLLHRARSLRRELPLNVIITVIAGAAAGLHHAHERIGHDGKPLGIVHRDVSPSNLMVSYEGSVKVVDFGVAKADNRVQETRSGTVKGKIAYLSPEQCRGGALDRRSDLFSLGIVFWEMLTVERLYKRNSDFENMTAIVTEDPVPPSSRRPGIPPELDAIVMRLLSKDPNHRYTSGDQLVEALEEVAPRLGVMISASSVSRLLRDMFGQRPEPWLDMDSTTVQAEQPEPGVTMASEPIPRELVAGPGASVDIMLAKVRDLSAHLPAEVPSDPSGGVIARSQAMTAQAMPSPLPHAQTAEPSVRPGASTVAFVPPPPPSYVPNRNSGGSIPPLFDSRPFPPTGPSSDEHSHSSGPNPTYGAGSQSGVHAYPSGSHTGYPLLQSSDPHPTKAQPRRWPLLAIVAIAALLGSLTVWALMRRGTKATPDAAVVAIADATAVALEPDAPAVAADVAVAVEPSDAAVATLEDAAVVGVATPDAAVQEKDPLIVAFDDQRFVDVVAACTREFRNEHASTCTIAACRTSQEPRAQKWHAKIANPATKRTIAVSCRELGVEVTPKVVRPPPPRPDAGVDVCAQNPMACQR